MEANPLAHDAADKLHTAWDAVLQAFSPQPGWSAEAMVIAVVWVNDDDTDEGKVDILVNLEQPVDPDRARALLLAVVDALDPDET